jgi:uncharacterized protein YndB with AHSA1/START domain
MTQVSETKLTEMPNQPPPLRLSRVLHARRETVFKAWSSAEHVTQWFSPEIYTVSDARVRMEVGGPFDVCMRSPTGEEHWTRGRFVEVTPHTRLVIDMHATDSAGAPLFRAFTEVDFADGGNENGRDPDLHLHRPRDGRADGGGRVGRVAHHAG